jgi:hypothetical protein
VGRQIAIQLAWEDEAELLSLAQDHDFILVDGWLAGPSFIEQGLKTLPTDEEAESYDFNCYLLPIDLARQRQAKLVEPQPGVRLERRYVVGTSHLPVIEWSRTAARRHPGFRFNARQHERLYVATSWNYGADQVWMPQVVDFYGMLVKRIKKLTIKIQATWPRYVSKRFAEEFFHVPGLVDGPDGWVYSDPPSSR